MSNIVMCFAVPFPIGRVQSVGRSALASCVEVRSMQSRQKINGQTCEKAKRLRLTHLTKEEKNFRRKMMCREASQKARDTVNIKMNALEKKLQHLRKERNVLLMENKTLKERQKQLCNENKSLVQATCIGRSTRSISNYSEDASHMKMLNASESAMTVPESLDNHGDRRSLGHAWFINTPLLKGQDLRQFLVLMTMMAVTELLSASLPHVSTEELIRNLAAISHPFISNLASGIIHTVLNSMHLPLTYHKSWT